MGACTGDTLSLSFFRQWAGGGDGWSDRPVCVLEVAAVCISMSVYGRESNCQDSTTFPGWGFLLTVAGGCPSTGGLQSPCISQAIQDSALLQHPEADLSRGGEGPARGLEESEVGVSRVGRGTSSHILGRSLLTHLWGHPSCHAPHRQASGSDHSHLGGCPSARDAAPG